MRTQQQATDGGADDSRPRLKRDGKTGDWIAVWNSENDLGGTIGQDNDIFISKCKSKKSPPPESGILKSWWRALARLWGASDPANP